MKPLHVTFVALGTEQLGISQISALAKRDGHEVSLAFSASLFHDRFNLEFPSIAPFFDDTKNVMEVIIKNKPDVICFSALTSTYQWMLDIARKAKEIDHRVKVIFGGVHPSAVPDLVLIRPQVDYVVVGEGDEAFPRILQNIAKGDFTTPIYNTRFKTPNGQVVIGIQKGFMQELDSLPFFDKTIWEEHVRLGDLYLTMASRGCPYRCTFCFNNFFAKLPEEKSGKYVRIRSVDHMIAELKIATKRYKIHKIDFQDDVFATSKKWLKDFSETYKKEINLPYNILTHPRYMDAEVAKWLKDSGCEWVQMGVQSMDENFKKDSLMRYEKSDHVSQALEVMHKHGLKAKVDHMLGLPDEPISSQEIARELYATHHPKRIQTFWTCYLPGTDMMKEAEQKGTITKEQANKINEGEDFYFFRNTENVKDKTLMDKYMAYEVIFRIMPVLPESWKLKIRTEHVQMIPGFLVGPAASISDIITGFRQKNPEFSAYALHNLYHLYKFVMRKIGIRVGPATKVRNDIRFDSYQYEPKAPLKTTQVSTEKISTEKEA